MQRHTSQTRRYPSIFLFSALLFSNLLFTSQISWAEPATETTEKIDVHPEHEVIEVSENTEGDKLKRRSTRDTTPVHWEDDENCRYHEEHQHYHCDDASEPRSEPLVKRSSYKHRQTRPKHSRHHNSVSNGIAIGLGIGLPILIHHELNHYDRHYYRGGRYYYDYYRDHHRYRDRHHHRPYDRHRHHRDCRH